MRLTTAALGNLNKIHWNRRVWEIGYRGPPLPQRKATGRPHYPVTTGRVALLRENFEREYGVMRCLATPYFTKDQEAAYWNKYKSVDAQNEAAKLEAKQRRMPGEVKRESEFKKADRRVANIGNNLHKHRTIEDSLGDLIRRNLAMTPGWNDPPFTGSLKPTANSNLPRKYRRPVDPSIQALMPTPSEYLSNGTPNVYHPPNQTPRYAQGPNGQTFVVQQNGPQTVRVGQNTDVAQALASKPQGSYQPQQAQLPKPGSVNQVLDMYCTSLCQPAFPEPGEPAGLGTRPSHEYQYQAMQEHQFLQQQQQQYHRQHHYQQQHQFTSSNGLTYQSI